MIPLALLFQTNKTRFTPPKINGYEFSFPYAKSIFSILTGCHSVTAEPIRFSFTMKLLIGPWKVYNSLREGTSTLTRAISSFFTFYSWNYDSKWRVNFPIFSSVSDPRGQIRQINNFYSCCLNNLFQCHDDSCPGHVELMSPNHHPAHWQPLDQPQHSKY